MGIKKSSTSMDSRVRNWTFIIYPESAHDNWRDILDNQHIQWVESPLHDKDINSDGTKKKAHWHVLLLFDGKKSYDQIKKLTDQLHATIPERCQSAKGLVRYMAHLDNPEKVRYPVSEIVGHGGVDVSEYLKLTSSSRYQIIKEMQQWVNSVDCIEFCDLFDYAAKEHFDDWFPLLCDNSAYIMGEFIKSRRNRLSSSVRVVKVDRNGEVVE